MAGLELGDFDGLAVLDLRVGALDGFAVGIVEISGLLDGRSVGFLAAGFEGAFKGSSMSECL